MFFVFISFWLNIKNKNPVTMALNNWLANTITPFCLFSNFNWYWQTNVVFVSWSKHLTEISVFSTPSFYLSKFPHTFNFQKISESLSKNLIFTLMWLQKKSMLIFYLITHKNPLLLSKRVFVCRIVKINDGFLWYLWKVFTVLI